MSGTPITGETGHTLNVSTSGMYYALIDYGNVCSGSGNTDSNIVDVTSAADSVGCQNGSILSSVLDTARPLMTAPDGSFVPAEDATTVHFQQDIPGCS